MFFSFKARLLKLIPVSVARQCVHRHSKNSVPSLCPHETKQLLVDVSVIVHEDSRTGIQRVVRALLQQLLNASPVGYRICPVFATRQHSFHYATDFLQPGTAFNKAGMRVEVNEGDIFLGLDLNAHLLPRHQEELLKWKRSGASIHFVVYDLLPLLHPEWFNPRTSRNFHRWLKTMAIFADSAICISNSVKGELAECLCKRFGLPPNALPIGVVHLGGNIDASLPSKGLPQDSEQLLKALHAKDTVLMVGTLEPRKGHVQSLKAFEHIWKMGRDANLVIVGKSGWKTNALQDRLRAHPLNKQCLYWLDNVSDEMLEQLYAAAKGILVASQGEGFGLPLIEAIHHNKPVLARDIPVFREIAGDSISYFSGMDIEGLAASLIKWLDQIDAGTFSGYVAPPPTWQETADQLLGYLGIKSVKSIQFSIN